MGGMSFGPSHDYGPSDRFDQPSPSGMGMGMRNAFMNQYSPFPNGMPPPQSSPFGHPQGQDPMDPFGQYGMYGGAPYGMLNPAAPTFSSGGAPGSRGGQGSRGGAAGQQNQNQSPNPNDWTSRFNNMNLGGNP